MMDFPQHFLGWVRLVKGNGVIKFLRLAQLLKLDLICKENLKTDQIRVSLTNRKNVKPFVKSYVCQFN